MNAWVPVFAAAVAALITGGFGFLAALISRHDARRRGDYEAVQREIRTTRRLIMGHVHTDAGVMAPVVDQE